jgi:hypothetical protein
MLVSSKGTVLGRRIVYRRVSIAPSMAARAPLQRCDIRTPQRQPAEIDKAADGTPPDPHLLRVIARVWDWRRWLDRGDVATIRGTAVAAGVTEPFVSPFLRLAYLAPGVLEGLSIRPRP